MMEIQKFMVLSLILLLHAVVTAQNSDVYNSGLSVKSNRLPGKLTGEVFYLSLNSNSSHFLQQDWVEGTITLKDGDVYEGIRMRYKAIDDELVAYNSNIQTLFIVDKNTVKQFTYKVPSGSGTFNERKFVNLDSLDTYLGRTFFEELYPGSAKLLAFYQIEEIKVNPYVDNTGKMRDTEFRLKTIYYILTKTIGLSRIQLKNRSLFTLYPENKKEIRKLLRKSRIAIADEHSAIQAFKLLDENGFLK
ncbi:MAG: hypothetical protein EP310_08135 [Bacteroidetes bacterium]|nr:MAG: hypothetical protein EP310_08135 [Bacteroidota bacterium]